MRLSLSFGQTVEQIEKDFDRDYWMTAAEAKEYGLVDEVLLTIQGKRKKRINMSHLQSM